MQTYIALLRAVNVGGTGKLPMADLRQMAKTLGFQNPRTYIQTGNLIFQTDRPRDQVATELETALAGYAQKPVGVILRAADDLAQVLLENPFPAEDPRRVAALFLSDGLPHDALEPSKGQSDEIIETGRNAIYIHFPSGMGRSKLRLPAMNQGTMRNMNTVRKLVQMTAGEEMGKLNTNS